MCNLDKKEKEEPENLNSFVKTSPQKPELKPKPIFQTKEKPKTLPKPKLYPKPNLVKQKL